LGANTLTPEDERKVTYHVRAKRGNLLFARSWLLVEGESEFWFMPEAARLLELDLELEGVCCVEFAQCGLAPLIKVAADLGIEWHVLADGDQAGQAYVATAKKYLGNAKEAQRITLLPSPNLELCLWNHGYQQIYEGAVGKQQQQNVTAAKGTPAYIEQTIRMAISSTSKPYLAIAVLEAAGKQKSPGLPPGVIGALNAAVNNARL
jgi:putative ATP-dependent endonuclease of OLD family